MKLLNKILKLHRAQKVKIYLYFSSRNLIFACLGLQSWKIYNSDNILLQVIRFLCCLSNLDLEYKSKNQHNIGLFFQLAFFRYNGKFYIGMCVYVPFVVSVFAFVFFILYVKPITSLLIQPIPAGSSFQLLA